MIAVTQGSLLYNDPNYRYPPLFPGALTITPAPLTITANNDSKTYGTVKTFGTAFTYTIEDANGNSIPVTGTVTDLWNNDTLTGVTETSTGASATELVGSYSIVPGTDGHGARQLRHRVRQWPAHGHSGDVDHHGQQ